MLSSKHFSLHEGVGLLLAGCLYVLSHGREVEPVLALEISFVLLHLDFLGKLLLAFVFSLDLLLSLRNLGLKALLLRHCSQGDALALLVREHALWNVRVEAVLVVHHSLRK